MDAPPFDRDSRGARRLVELARRVADLERPVVRVTVVRPVFSLVVGRSLRPGDEVVVSAAHARALVASGVAVAG